MKTRSRSKAHPPEHLGPGVVVPIPQAHDIQERVQHVDELIAEGRTVFQFDLKAMGEVVRVGWTNWLEDRGYDSKTARIFHYGYIDRPKGSPDTMAVLGAWLQGSDHVIQAKQRHRVKGLSDECLTLNGFRSRTSGWSGYEPMLVELPDGTLAELHATQLSSRDVPRSLPALVISLVGKLRTVPGT